MSLLIRLVYISRSTFVSAANIAGIEPNVGRILAKSRQNNRQKNLFGGIYFGDGCFLQCLEGEAHTVDALYQKLLTDPRHKDVKLLSRQGIERVTFKDWSMKYVPVEKAVGTLLTAEGLARFDPYALPPDAIVAAVERLRMESDPTTEPVRSGTKQQPARCGGVATAPTGQPSPGGLATRSLRMAQWSIAMSFAALLIAAGVALKTGF